MMIRLQWLKQIGQGSIIIVNLGSLLQFVIKGETKNKSPTTPAAVKWQFNNVVVSPEHENGGKVREQGKNIITGTRGRVSSLDEIYQRYKMNKKKQPSKHIQSWSGKNSWHN